MLRNLMVAAMLAGSVSMVATLQGCAAFTPAQSFDQRLAYAASVHTGVMSAAANSVRAGDLSSAQGEQVLKLADDAKRILDAAKLASDAGDITTAQGQLSLATSVLTRIQTYLRESR